MRPYKPHGRFYRVSGVQRPNKLAAGLQATRDRSKHSVHKSSDDVLRLTVSGTCDTLGKLINWYTERSKRVCPCCGQRVQSRVLSERGRAKLRRMREAAQ